MTGLQTRGLPTVTTRSCAIFQEAKDREREPTPPPFSFVISGPHFLEEAQNGKALTLQTISCVDAPIPERSGLDKERMDICGPVASSHG